MAEISDEQAKQLIALLPLHLRRNDAEGVRASLDLLLQAERFRRGEPDPVSGALHSYALSQGALLRYEYDLSTHGHYAGWEIGAVVIDIRSLILVNQEHGFPTGDAVLRAVATSLSELLPTAKVVRLHADAFAVLLPPSAETLVDEALEERARATLSTRVPELLEAGGHPRVALDYTVALLHLTLVKPSHWQVLGPLVWAECERALTMKKLEPGSGVLRRRIELDGAVPSPA